MSIFCSAERGTVTLTRPTFRVMTSTKCEVNMTMKYHVASLAIVSKMVVTRTPCNFDFFAHKVTKKKARASVVAHVIG